MSHKVLVRFGVILALVMAPTPQSTTAQPRKLMDTAKITKSMNSSELAIIEIIRTSCSDLSTKADDPHSMAIKLGNIINIQSMGYYVEPSNHDLDSIRIDLDGSLTTPPYPAFSVNLELRRKAPISIKALGEVFGSYQDTYQSNINYETISFDENILESCQLYADFKRASDQSIENGKIIRIYLVK